MQYQENDPARDEQVVQAVEQPEVGPALLGAREPSEGEDHGKHQVARDARRGEDTIEVANLGILGQRTPGELEALQEVAHHPSEVAGGLGRPVLGADEHRVQRPGVLSLEGHEGPDVVHQGMQAAVKEQLVGAEDVQLLVAVDELHGKLGLPHDREPGDERNQVPGHGEEEHTRPEACTVGRSSGNQDGQPDDIPSHRRHVEDHVAGKHDHLDRHEDKHCPLELAQPGGGTVWRQQLLLAHQVLGLGHHGFWHGLANVVRHAYGGGRLH
mmetsp:Transcript_77591/g.227529  ORF Transcript_77591/g.227529 Transcript_77591/m.227529 type:complete len:269 (+) Transcript_77591:1283-2089(+)